MNHKLFRISAVLLGIAVALGAFGAHGLKDMVEPDRIDVWEKAVRYQMLHAIALMIVAVAAHQLTAKTVKITAAFFQVGILLFSGSLYLLVLLDVPVLGAVTPIGGLAMIAGWITLVMHKPAQS
ncbi:MAG: DUF423 domain-containing protein [Planctomycetes bacterium]|nr:DUF423 domain-containing protein [Planctomycetota bacterium]